jgi:hypothetical protein
MVAYIFRLGSGREVSVPRTGSTIVNDGTQWRISYIDGDGQAGVVIFNKDEVVHLEVTED